ncbi:DUF5979 domain-containing protein [Cellulosimicrobium marinum]|uniref:DUF5979 domain-containing protein n=1 Tax=Cellulosimicrobium marinum TaxID=1638992 RepID=UPI001E508109|nr:DUF5979 domain-containing protein [Cellulosimicrobium marinum]MCB7136011.1 choice-of-anchor A family protein [Cellulosimicrobium marinum]
MTLRPTAPVLDRARRVVAALVAAALALAGALVLVTGPQARPAAAAIGFCPEDGDFPDIINPPPFFTDNNVAVYAGGDYTASGSSAETEGVLVVAGDATFDTPGSFNVGSVGAGSGIVPEPGATMLHVGGSMSVAAGTNVIVGAGLDGGGAVHVGGSLTNNGGLDTNGGPVETDMGADAALAPWQDFGSVIAESSAALGTVPDTGVVAAAGSSLSFVGDGTTTSMQVFTVSADVLDGTSEFVFTNIPEGTPILVNVVGDAPVSVSANFVSINGERVDDPANIGNAAAQTMWNFTGGGDVTVSGSGQWVGSVLAPNADQVVLTSSTNGRIYAGNDLTTAGNGNEQHNYPWIGPAPFDCIPSSSFAVQKAVSGEGAAAVPADTTFTVEYTYETPEGDTGGDTLTVPIGGELVYGPDLPVGTVVTIEEVDLPVVDGVEWGDVVIRINGEPQGNPATFTVEEGMTLTVTVDNTANLDGPEVGGFSVAKAVTGDASGLVPDDTEFTVEWTATIPDGATYDGETTGTLTILADGTVVDGPQDLPVGTTVTFSEPGVPEIEGVDWGVPDIAPNPVTVGAGENTLVTVTNTADAVVGGFSLAKTVTGDAAGLVPDDTAFDMLWVATLPDGVEYAGDTSGTLTVLADGTVVDGPQDLPIGTTVRFVEVPPLPDIDGVVWGPPSFSPESPITIEADTTIAITLTNTASTEVGGFAVRKVVAGDSSGVVPGDTEFLVDWTATIPDGVEYEGPTSGTLTILADGTVVDGPTDLPVGTVVTFTEQTPLPEVPGVDWGTPSISPTEVTIGAGDELAGVTVTNTADSVVGGFSVAKDVTGDAEGVVPDDTEFTVEWTATIPDGVVYDGETSGTLTVLADGTVVDGPQDLPVGTTVSFSEPDFPEIPGVDWGTPSFDPESPITIGDGTVTAVTVTNTADAVVGGFSLSKSVSGDAAGLVPGDTEFLVDWTATIPDGVEYDGETSGTLTLLADGTVVDGPQDLPMGTTVELTEQTPLPEIPGVDWGTPSFDPGSPITIVGQQNAVVTLTNTADAVVGGFSLAKAVAGNAAGLVPDDTEFLVDWTATVPDGVVYDGETSGTLTILADGTVVDGPQDLPLGTTVSFTEQTPLPEIAGMEWGTTSIAPDPVTVGEGENTLVTVTNTATALVGGFSVAKSVTGDSAGVVPDDTEFTVTWTATLPDGVTYSPTTGTLTVLADGTVVDGPQDLPVGTTVTFSEPSFPTVPGVDWGLPAEISPNPVTIEEDANTLVTVTNTANSIVGGFSLAKAVTGDASGLVPGDTEFLVDWTATVPDGVVYDGETSGTLTLLADGTVVDGPQDLPEGTTVSFTEQTPLPEIPGVEWGTPSFDPESPITIEGQVVTEVTLTNTAGAQVGGFSLAKAVTGDAAGVVPDDTEFLVDWTATIPDGATYDGDTSGTLTVLADGTVVDGPQDLPLGTTVELTEQTPLPEIPGVIWGLPSFDPAASITVEESGETVAVTLTNTASSEVGAFAVAKTVDGAGTGLVPVDTAFQVAWTAAIPDGVEYDGATSGTLTVLADGTVADGPDDLPTGTVVTFEEVDLPDVPGVTWGTPALSPSQITIGAGDDVAGVTVTNTANQVVGGFSVAKALTGDGASAVPDDTAFTVTWAATLPDGSTYDGDTSGTLTVLADGTVVDGPQDLPVGTTVELGEVDLPDVEDVEWGTPVFTVDGEETTTVTVADGDPALVTLTNTATRDRHLATTGSDVVGALGVAAALLLSGVGILIARSRRRGDA